MTLIVFYNKLGLYASLTTTPYTNSMLYKYISRSVNRIQLLYLSQQTFSHINNRFAMIVILKFACVSVCPSSTAVMGQGVPRLFVRQWPLNHALLGCGATLYVYRMFGFDYEFVSVLFLKNFIWVFNFNALMF